MADIPIRRVIQFYSKLPEYKEFSNFAPFPIVIKGKEWPSTEHYFQAQKFAGTPHVETIRQAKNPGRAKQLGKQPEGRRKDWEYVKEEVMRVALYAKFTQHHYLQRMLLQTGDAILVEHSESDRYWGDGGDGTGKNRMGVLLEETRARINAELSAGATPGQVDNKPRQIVPTRRNPSSNANQWPALGSK